MCCEDEKEKNKDTFTKNKGYYEKLINMNYWQAIATLNETNGKVCKKYGKNNRPKKTGFHVHHVAELTVYNLSKKENIEKYYYFQEPEFLAYCDLIEHFIIHYLIIVWNKSQYQYDKMNDESKYNSIKILNKNNIENPNNFPNGMNSLLGMVNKFYIKSDKEKYEDPDNQEININSKEAECIVEQVRDKLSESLEHNE